jgi:hypothetical protein
MAIGKRLRFEILKRDGFRCRYCGKKGSASQLHIDHMKPKSKGGGDDPQNLIAACIDCNAGKSNVTLETIAAPPTPIDRVIDDGLFWARHEAKYTKDLAENKEYTESDMLEIWFPDGLPEGFI